MVTYSQRRYILTSFWLLQNTSDLRSSSFELNSVSDDALKSAKRLLNDLSVKLCVLDSRMFLGFFSVESALRDLASLAENDVVTLHPPVAEIVSSLTLAMKAIFRAGPSQAKSGLFLASNTVECLNQTLTAYYVDGDKDALLPLTENVQSLLMWIHEIEG